MNITQIDHYQYRDELIDLAARFADFSIPDSLSQEKFAAKQKEMMKSDLLETKSLFWGAFEQSKLIGFIETAEEVNWMAGEKQLYLSRLVVAKAFEGKGIAGKLLLEVEDYARLENYHRLTLNVFEKNQRAKDFYTNSGFQTEVCKMTKKLF